MATIELNSPTLECGTLAVVIAYQDTMGAFTTFVPGPTPIKSVLLPILGQTDATETQRVQRSHHTTTVPQTVFVIQATWAAISRTLAA